LVFITQVCTSNVFLDLVQFINFVIFYFSFLRSTRIFLKPDDPPIKKESNKKSTATKSKSLPVVKIEELELEGRTRSLRKGSIKCPHCNHKKGFASEKGLEYHIARRHVLNCSVCEKQFRTSVAKLSHEKTVHKGNPNIISRYNCSLCEPRRNFGTTARLIQHMYKKHENHINDVDKTLVCGKENCGKKFGIEFLYQRHLDVHEIEDKKPFSCQRCEMHFKTEARLEIHALTHTKYKCKLCDKNFSKKYALDR
jgi:transcription elongation factor Elf1